MEIKDRILVVEDDKRISSFFKTVLESNRYDVIMASTGSEAYSLITSQCPDLVILDLGLPDMDGMNILRSVREWSSMPVIVVSARTHEKDKVEALDLGADDYITKPFNILEVKARIKAIMRRNSRRNGKNGRQEDHMVVCGDLKLDREGRRVFIQEKEIKLTAKEFDLLELLVTNPNKVYSREALLGYVWGNKAMDNGDVRTVDVHVRRLREKIEPSPSDPKYVHTKWGVGYYFRA